MDISEKLREIAEGSSEKFQEFRSKGDLNAEEVFRILQSKSQYDVVHVKIFACKGIKSVNGTENQADFELAVFVNYPGPPFDPVLSDFERSLVRHTCKRHKCIFQSRTNFSIEFRMKDISSEHPKDFVSFQLFPAKYLLSSEEGKLPEAMKVDMQTERALKLICALVNPRQETLLYNSSLAEKLRAFVENQSCFVKSLVRLAKLWNRKVRWDGNEKLHGRAVLIELVAISAANSEEVVAKKAGREGSILAAFQFFLKKFLNFDRYMCELFKCPHTIQLVIPYTKFGEETCAMGGPVILDPVNPFNNFATNVTQEMKWGLQSQAKITLKALQVYGRCGHGKYFNMEGYFGI